MVSTTRKKELFNAVVSRYEADIARHRVTLHMYINDPIAVADHSNIVEEIVGLVDKLASSEDSLKSLKQKSEYLFFADDSDEE
jgi:hypothetical protein|tara:strand:- start:341 stop:589 length:249 start_codon:yes stop_codon:yes gene_type:complete